MDMGPFDFLPVQRIEAFEMVSLDVPARWTCGRDESGMWGCWAEGEESGTLWIDFDADSLDKTLDIDHAMHEAATRGTKPLVTDPMQLCHGGSERGVELRFYKWHIIALIAPVKLMTHFTLVVFEELADRGDFAVLVGLIDQSVRSGKGRFNPNTVWKYGYPNGRGGLCGRSD